MTWAACREPGVGGDADLTLVDGPSLATVHEAPLSAELTVETDRPTELQVHLEAPGVDVTVSFPGLRRRHVVPLLGGKPDRDVVVRVVLVSADGRRVDAETSFRTPALDPDFPEVDVRVSDPGAVFDSAVLMPLQTPFGRSWLVALDPRDGEAVWAYRGPWNFVDVDVTPRGTLLGLAEQGFVEIDLLGRQLLRMVARGEERAPGEVRIEAGGLTHELVERDGTYVTLANAARDVAAYPTSTDDPADLAPARIVDQEVLTIGTDGAVLERWSLADRLDVTRIGFGSLDRFGDAFDWAHANAVVPYAGGWLVSLRHQDAFVSLDAAGDVRWILSHPYGFSPEREALLLSGPGEDGWPLHPHGPSFDGDGRLVFFDNGNEGHTPYTEPADGAPTSRVVALAIDETRRTAAVAWTWSPPAPLFSAALGNAAALPNGHVLADFGFLDAEGGVDNLAAGRGVRSVHVYEVAPGVGEPVVDLHLWTPADRFPDGVKLYRAIPVESLYAEGIGVEHR